MIHSLLRRIGTLDKIFLFHKDGIKNPMACFQGPIVWLMHWKISRNKNYAWQRRSSAKETIPSHGQSTQSTCTQVLSLSSASAWRLWVLSSPTGQRQSHTLYRQNRVRFLLDYGVPHLQPHAGRWLKLAAPSALNNNLPLTFSMHHGAHWWWTRMIVNLVETNTIPLAFSDMAVDILWLYNFISWYNNPSRVWKNDLLAQTCPAPNKLWLIFKKVGHTCPLEQLLWASDFPSKTF